MSIITRRIKATGLKDEDVTTHISEKQSIEPQMNIAETENYIQLEKCEYYNTYTKEVNIFENITHKGIKYIPLKSKKEEGKDCFWNKETGGILVWFSSKKDWYPCRSIDRICEVTIMNEFGPKKTYDGRNIENFQIDIDAYMRGEVDLEFDNSDEEGGRTHIAFYIRKWMLNNSPDKALTVHEIGEVIAEQNRKNGSHTPYAERGGGREVQGGWPMVVEWK
jgi:hypothetical protein